MQTEIKIGRGLSVQLSLQAAHLLVTLWLTLPFGPWSLGGMVIGEWPVLWWEKLKSGSVLQLSRFPTHCSWMIHLFWSTPFSVIEIFSKVTSMASNVESIAQWCNDWIDTCYTFPATFLLLHSNHLKSDPKASVTKADHPCKYYVKCGINSTIMKCLNLHMGHLLGNSLLFHSKHAWAHCCNPNLIIITFFVINAEELL